MKRFNGKSNTSEPRFAVNLHKHSWSQRQKAKKELIKQRTLEWKEKQLQHQLTRSNSLSQHAPLSKKSGQRLEYQYKSPRGSGNLSNAVVPHSQKDTSDKSGSVEHSTFGSFPPTFSSSSSNTIPLAKRRRTDEFDFPLVSAIGSLRSVGNELVSYSEPIITDVTSLNDQNSRGECTRRKKAKHIDKGDHLHQLEFVNSSSTATKEFPLGSERYISDVVGSLPYTAITDDHQVAQINGLLSLPSMQDTHHSITYGELKRRCGYPEYLTRTDMVAYIRQSKSSARSLLDKYRINTGSKTSHPNIMSKMCEKEVQVLSKGILKMNIDYFPVQVLSRIATQKINRISSENDDFQQHLTRCRHQVNEKLASIDSTRTMLKEIFDLLQTESDLDEMKTFELASHTFGISNAQNHLLFFDRFLHEYQNNLTMFMEDLEFKSENHKNR